MAKRYMSFSSMSEDELKKKVADHPEKVTDEEIASFLDRIAASSDSEGARFDTQVIPLISILARRAQTSTGEELWDIACKPAFNFIGKRTLRISKAETKKAFLALVEDFKKEMIPVLDPLPGVSKKQLPLKGITTSVITVMATVLGNLVKCGLLKRTDDLIRLGEYPEPSRANASEYGVWMTTHIRMVLSSDNKLMDVMRYGIVDLVTKSLDGTYGEDNAHLIEVLVDSIVLLCLDTLYSNSLIDCAAIDKWASKLKIDMESEERLRDLCKDAASTFLKEKKDEGKS